MCWLATDELANLLNVSFLFREQALKSLGVGYAHISRASLALWMDPWVLLSNTVTVVQYTLFSEKWIDTLYLLGFLQFKHSSLCSFLLYLYVLKKEQVTPVNDIFFCWPCLHPKLRTFLLDWPPYFHIWICYISLGQRHGPHEGCLQVESSVFRL